MPFLSQTSFSLKFILSDTHVYIFHLHGSSLSFNINFNIFASYNKQLIRQITKTMNKKKLMKYRLKHNTQNWASKAAVLRLANL